MNIRPFSFCYGKFLCKDCGLCACRTLMGTSWINMYKHSRMILQKNQLYVSQVQTVDFIYIVSEVNDKQANIKYDEHVYKIKVTVTDDGSGTLTAEVSDDSIVFTNHYTPAGTGTDTGDDSSMAVALGLMMMAATAGGAVLVRRKINQ
ncbi:MAG: FctA domain-containing protein [Eubacteriales bacterium]|nr:FctA domain-containing protein [Eubacteriales bacterium]